jgi:hypothetical protein
VTNKPGAPDVSAVTRQAGLHLLAELSDLLGSEHGPVPKECLAEAQAAWPDSQ